MFEFFGQDSWKVTPKLHLDYGLRYTVIQPYYSLWGNISVFDPPSYSAAKAVQQDPKTGNIIPGTGDIYNGLIIPGSSFPSAGKGRFPASTDPQFTRLFKGPKQYSDIHYNDFQPRIGIAYSLNQKTVLRAGAGRYFTRLGVSDSVFLGGNPPFQPTVSTANGLVDNPGAAAATGSVPFPLTVTSQDPIFKNPESYQWNTTVQREFAYGTTIEVAYVGRRALHQQRERNINALQPGTVQANPGINPDFLRPYKGYAVIRVTNNDANALYNALQISANKRFAKGVAFGLAYTLSKSSDDGSAQRDILPNPFSARNLWGPTDYDRRHVFVGNLIYELPFWRTQHSLIGKIAGGWQISMVVQLQTGTPFTVGTGDDVAGIGPGNGTGVSSNTGNSMPATIYNIVADPHLSDPKFSQSNSDQNFYFKTVGTFAKPADGTFTTQRDRNLLYNPGFQNWTAALFKNFKIGERQTVVFRSEFYDFPNHANWNNVASVNPNDASFGRVNNKNFERTIQLSLRYQF